MSVANLPPQAYTKELLAEAYSWLTSQPDHVKRRATSADSLISLYLRAKRQGAIDKVSTEEFKSELRSLAGMMDHFSPPQASVSPVPQVEPAQPPPQPHVAPAPVQQETPAPQAPKKPDILEALDRQTLMLLYDVKMRLNLGSELDALRMLVKLGYQKVKPLLPDEEII